jgi:hypothetical protein
VEAAVTRTLESTPADAAHWSTRTLGRELGLSPTAVSRIWRAFGLKPHRHRTFNRSTDPLFAERVRDVVGLCLSPPERAIVLCVDDKSQVQALDRTQPTQPLLPGRPAKGTHDYPRHGTTSLFAALNVATGQGIGQCHRRHRHPEFVAFLDRPDATVVREAGAAVHVVMDTPARTSTQPYPKGRERGNKVLGEGDSLDGGKVLPGFTLPVADLFAPRAPKATKKKGKK